MLSFLLKNHEIGHYSGYQTRVFADYFYELSSEDDIAKLAEIYQWTQNERIPLLIIGGGTNLLFASDLYEGVVIKNSLSGWQYDTVSNILYTSSDESIWEIANQLETKYYQPLWHRFIGLPGSIGGAIYGNAGCFGLETESNFVSCEVYDMLSNEQKTIPKSEMGFSYRHSFLKDNPHLFLISATFDLSEKHEKYHSDVDNIYFREHQQPKGNSCGSFFKNPSKENSAGSLIERVGLKGYRHGGAYWSTLHANFLMSDGLSCPPSDLIGLVGLTQEIVKKETGIELENEVRIIENIPSKK
ncbi:UDP-N-acetylmuramate dehydrogenase [Candidatus Gracilibacteria bacterium]|nr:UDP-N-acetylmuramate dehydrogenase [Candidatus Gracilibacteria bacterium]